MIKKWKKFLENNDQFDDIRDHFIELSDDDVLINIEESRKHIHVKFTKNGGLSEDQIINIFNSCRRLDTEYPIFKFEVQINDDIGLSSEFFKIDEVDTLKEYLDMVGSSEFVVSIILNTEV